MKELAAAMGSCGCERLGAYIQSGNAVFRHQADGAGAIQAVIADELGEVFGFRPEVLILTVDQLETAIEDNPFPAATEQPGRLHAFFFAGEPAVPSIEVLEQSKTDSESFVLGRGVFYLRAPDGIGRSRLARRVERLLGVPPTARNWRTVMKLYGLAQEIEQ